MWSMVGDHPIAGLTVDHSGPDSRRQTGEIGQGLLAQLSQSVGVAHGGMRLRTAARAINKIRNQMCNSSSKKKPTRAGGHRAGFSTGVMRVGLGPNCRSHRDCATLKSMASARSRMPNGIYPYLYQIAGAEVEFIRTDQRHDRVSRNHRTIGVFVPLSSTATWGRRNRGCGRMALIDGRPHKSLLTEKQRRHVRLPSAGPCSPTSPPDRPPHRSPGGSPPRSAHRGASAPWRCAEPSADWDRAPPSGCSRC